MAEITLRRADAEDAESVYEWRNAPETRRNAFDAESLSWDEHRQWFANVLERDDRHLLIGEAAGKPVGVLRYDTEADAAVVSVYLVPGLAGRGLGTSLLQAGCQWVRENLPGISVIHANIKPENAASRRAFEKAGFEKASLVYHFNLD